MRKAQIQFISRWVVGILLGTLAVSGISAPPASAAIATRQKCAISFGDVSVQPNSPAFTYEIEYSFAFDPQYANSTSNNADPRYFANTGGGVYMPGGHTPLLGSSAGDSSNGLAVYIYGMGSGTPGSQHWLAIQVGYGGAPGGGAKFYTFYNTDWTFPNFTPEQGASAYVHIAVVRSSSGKLGVFYNGKAASKIRDTNGSWADATGGNGAWITDTNVYTTTSFVGKDQAFIMDANTKSNIATVKFVRGTALYTPTAATISLPSITTLQAPAPQVISTLGTITGGSGYTNGTYSNVRMTLQSGTSPSTFPLADIVVSGGHVTSVTLTGYGIDRGVGANTSTVLTAPNSSLGGSGSGFSIPVTSLSDTPILLNSQTAPTIVKNSGDAGLGDASLVTFGGGINDDACPASVTEGFVGGIGTYNVYFVQGNTTADSGSLATTLNVLYPANLNDSVSLNLPGPGSLTKSGKYLKWNTKLDGSGTDYATGASVSVTGSTTFYTKWVSGAALSSQSITFTQPGTLAVGYDQSLTATAAGGTVTFLSDDTNVCTVSGSTVTAVALGTCSITANQFGNVSYYPANAVTKTFNIVAAATSYTLTGPTGGIVNADSTNFTVTPVGGIFTGDITIALAGGGLTGTIVKTFSASNAAQTFTIKPTAAGVVSLTPTNSRSISNPAALNYSTTATSYTVTGPTSGIVNSSSTDFTITPVGGIYTGTISIAVSGGGLSTTISKTFTASSAAQTFTITPSAAGNVTLTPTASAALGTNPTALTYTANTLATSYTVAGPTKGIVNSSSTDFTITPVGGIYTGTISIAVSGGGLSTTISKTFTASSAAQTFTITPSAAGNVTLTPTASAALGTNPTALTYTANTLATSYTVAGPSTGPFNTASTNFTVTPVGGIYSGKITITPSGGGLSTPIELTFTETSTAQTFTITPTVAGTVTLTPTASAALGANPAALTYTTTATSFTLSGPTAGVKSAQSSNFTITPVGGIYTGTISIAVSGGGLSTTIIKTFTASSAAQTLTITPTVVGSVTLTATNNGSLSNPTALTYLSSTAATSYTVTGPTIGTVNTDSSNFTITPVGGIYTGTISIAVSGGGLSTTISKTFTASSAAQTFTIKPTATGSVTLTPTASPSLGTNPRALTYTVNNASTSYTLTGPASGIINTNSTNFTVTPVGGIYTGNISIAVSGGGLSTTILETFTASSAAQTFTIRPTAAGNVTLTATASPALGTNPTALTYVANTLATGYTLTGPNSGQLNATSTNFTITPTGGVYTGNISIAVSGGGLNATITKAFSASSTAQTFTIKPTVAGTVTLTPTAAPTLGTNPTALSYATTANSYTITGPTSGRTNVDSADFSITPVGGNYTGNISIALSGAGLGNTITIPFNARSTPLKFAIHPTQPGTVTLTPTNNGSLINPANLSYVATDVALSYKITGPTMGATGVASNAFTISPLNGVYTGDITVAVSGGGLNTTITKSFSTSSTPQTFTITPTAAGAVTLTPSNNGSLRNPLALNFTAYTDAKASCPITVTSSNVIINSSTVATTFVGTRCVIQFLGVGTYTVTAPAKVSNVDYLVVAGGGGGGSGGGGAGGVVQGLNLPVVSGTSYTVTVGAGGTGGIGGNDATQNDSHSSNGGDSTLDVLTAVGGGAGGESDINDGHGALGGSGGGSRFDCTDTENCPGPGTAGQGSGGANSTHGGYGGGGGGGGAGGAGGNTTLYHIGGNGGSGIASTITGSTKYYAGGGGGSINSNDNQYCGLNAPAYRDQDYACYQTSPATNGGGVGGIGGGGSGSSYGYAGVGRGLYANASAGTDNTGGGGGGTDPEDAGGAPGGSGIVILSFLNTANLKSITFNSNINTPTTTAQYVAPNSATTLAANPFSATGYFFTSWNTAADGSGTRYADTGQITTSADVTLYAMWAQGTGYAITFHAPDATFGSMPTQISGLIQTLYPNRYTRSGYQFAGWNTQSGGGGTDYADGATYSFTSNTDLYAKWTPLGDIHTVSFFANDQAATGGTASQASITPAPLNPNGFSKPGFSFLGWNSNYQAGNAEYLDQQNFAFDSNKSLFAIWVPEAQHTVSFDKNDTNATGTTTSQAATNKTVLNANGFSKSGYSFLNWNTQSGGGGVSYKSGYVYSFGADLRLFAIWSKNLTLTYDKNGATGGAVPASQSFYVGGPALTIQRDTGLLTQTGKILTGWNDKSDGSGTAYALGQQNVILPATTTKLFAQWAAGNVIISAFPATVRSNFGQITSTPNGSYVAATNIGNSVYTSDTQGTAWVKRAASGSRFWTSIASSSDGANLVASEVHSVGKPNVNCCKTLGDIYTSADSGVTWTNRTSSTGATPGARNWAAVASDSGGMKIVSIEVMGGIWRSSNGGAAWTDISPDATARNWSGVCMDSTGSYIAASSKLGGIWISKNEGRTWSETTVASGFGGRIWSSITCDSDLKYIAAAAAGERIFTSSDYGTTWTSQGASQYVAGASSRAWSAIASDPSGMNIVATAQDGYIYTSADRGVTWWQQTGVGISSWNSVTTWTDGAGAIHIGALAYVGKGMAIFTRSDSGKP
jgi:uncharacterized repeat protein (TIGR02543 family)